MLPGVKGEDSGGIFGGEPADAPAVLWADAGRGRLMRGCTCRGLTLCPQCQQLAQRAGVSPPAPPPVVSEKAFQSAVVRLAKERGWMVHFATDSRKSPPGYPDLTLCRGQELLVQELKIPGGVLTLLQHHWLEGLQRVTHIEAGIWMPEDLDHIRKRLT